MSMQWVLATAAAGVAMVGSMAMGQNAAPAPRPQAEVRGTWVTTTANEAISSPANTARTMRELRHIGLNTVYVETWKNGYTEFPSKVMERFIGVPMKINPSPGGPAIQRDLLAETLIEAHRNQLVYVAWFEYGFMAAHKSTQNELRARKDWILIDNKGSEVINDAFVWMNPLHPDAQELLIGIVVEAVKNYDLDGVQLDDRIVWPVSAGYDEFTRRMYAQENNGAEPPADINDPHWRAWREKKVTEFSRRFVAAVKEANPNVIVSLSPGPHPWALEHYLCNWPAWSKWTDTPTWDEYIPQVYRMNFEGFERTWKDQVEAMAHRPGDLLAGIRVVGDGPDLPPGDAARSAELARQTSAGGHVWWFSRGVLDVRRDEITSFYDAQTKGQAPHPRLGADWRPAPLVATRGDAGWRVHVPVEGKYRLIAFSDGAWKEIKRLDLKEGTQDLGAVEGEKVELLRDRRPW